MGVEIKRLIRVITESGIGALLSICGALPAMAGGYTQPKGFTFTALGVNTYDTESFHKLEIQPYIEHGLQENVTLILKFPYTWLEDNNGKYQGFTDQEVGLRWRFNQNPVAAAIQGNLILPLGYDSEQDPLSNQVVGVELSLPVSGSFQLGQRNGYGTVEVSYRDYLGPPSDELRLSGEVSLNVAKPLAIATQFFSIYRLQSGEIDFTKLGGQLRWVTNDRLTLVLGGFKNISGEGSGFEAQIWYNFGSRSQEPRPVPPIGPSIPSVPSGQ